MYHVGMATLTECDLLNNCTPNVPTNVCCHISLLLKFDVRVDRFISVASNEERGTTKKTALLHLMYEAETTYVPRLEDFFKGGSGQTAW